jgi:hypothetical protein
MVKAWFGAKMPPENRPHTSVSTVHAPGLAQEQSECAALCGHGPFSCCYSTPCLQILNLENFQIAMYSVIRATNYLSSMYWLAWIIVGKFIFLTLFLAVTLDAFERKYEVRLPLAHTTARQHLAWHCCLSSELCQSNCSCCT